MKVIDMTSTDPKGVVSGEPERRSDERSEADRSGGSPDTTPACGQVVDTEVKVGSKRRYLTINYKLRILKEVEACTNRGEIGAILRREGLYSSNISSWKKLRDQGAKDALGKKRGPAPTPVSPADKEIKTLKRENDKLRKRLVKAEAIIEFQKKIAEIMDWNNPSTKINVGK